MKTKFPIWRSVVIENKPDLNGINISFYVNDMIEKIPYPVKRQKIDLVKVTVGELGFTKGYSTTSEIYTKAHELGLALCPPQVGLQLREDYREQSQEEWISIGMEPITDSRVGPRVFGLRRGGDRLWLYGPWAGPDSWWYLDSEFVFVSTSKNLKSKTLGTPQLLNTLESLAMERRIQELEEKVKKLLNVIKV